MAVAVAGALLTLWLALRALGPEGPAPEGARTTTVGESADGSQDVTVPADGVDETSDAAGDATEQTPESAPGTSVGEALETVAGDGAAAPELVSGTSSGEALELVPGNATGDVSGTVPGASAADATVVPVAPTSGGSSLPGLSRHLSLRALPEEARSVLEGYRDGGYCVLVQSGYLDLFGRVWSCTVSGGTWVELQVLREVPDGGGTEVVSVRMDADSWADLDIEDLEAGMQEMGGM